MQLGRLQIFQAPVSETQTPHLHAAEDGVSVTLEEILPLLAEAFHNKRTWLKDFGTEPLTITQDLYDVLTAYDRYTKSESE